ncbi:hypothetical protein BHE16_07185 [Neomicrococcus aestuarii]|uniref:DUF4190 domain-containing protein n=2 Tax=Neomicrococcus aestuarii TaxID=556325 RepID=A0A1L2ZP44_9MICC|nr:hypothetical protein BHE16_07185 [Neomicrococcus aestuarii]
MSVSPQPVPEMANAKSPAQGLLDAIRESWTPRYFVGLALVLFTFALLQFLSFLTWKNSSESFAEFVSAFREVTTFLVTFGLLILPGRLKNRLIAVAILLGFRFGLSPLIGRILANRDSAPNDILDFVHFGLIYTAYVAVWMLARRRSIFAFAVILPITLIVFSINLPIINKIPFEFLSVFPVNMLVNIGTLVILAWAAWAIDQRQMLKSLLVSNATLHPNSPHQGAEMTTTPPAQYQTNGLAIAALVLAIIVPVVGLVLGYVARGQIQRDGSQGAGLAQAAIVIGWVFVAIWAVSFLLLMMTVVGASA